MRFQTQKLKDRQVSCYMILKMSTNRRTMAKVETLDQN